MIGTSFRRVSKAGSSNERILAFSLWLSVLASGMYFKETWFILGGILGLYALGKGVLGFLTLRYERQGFYHRSSRFAHLRVALPAFEATDFVLLGMAGLSALGLLRPVQVEAGLIEVLRWLVYWLIYRFVMEMRRQGYGGQHLLVQVQWAAVAVAAIGWLPWTGLIWPAPSLSEAGRLSSVFGYPNGTAAFLGAALLLPGGNYVFRAFLAVSFLSTGSRAALAVFLFVLVLKGLRAWKEGKMSFLGTRVPIIKVAKIIALAAFILIVSFKIFPNAWEHFRSWNPLSPSIGQRLLYYRDGLSLAWQAEGWPRAGGWLAFPTVQSMPYWTGHPHSAFIHILLNQGFVGLVLLGSWAVRAWRKMGEGAQKWALLFLMLHSLLDADLAFGALGLVFWLLSGLSQTNSSGGGFYQPARRDFAGHSVLSARVMRPGVYLLVALYLLFLPASTLVRPDLLNPGQALSREAERLETLNPGQSVQLWQQSLHRDQTQIAWRRHLAELTLAQGDVEAGLRAIEEALAWRSFDLGAYEWAQGAVLRAADSLKSTKGNGDILHLYQWAQSVPNRIRDKKGSTPSYVRIIWPEWENFNSTPAIDLMAEYARAGQLTPANP